MSKNGELKSPNATMGALAAALWGGMGSSKDCGTPGPVLHLAELPRAQCWLQTLSWIIPGSICSTGPEPAQLPAHGYRPLQPSNTSKRLAGQAPSHPYSPSQGVEQFPNASFPFFPLPSSPEPLVSTLQLPPPHSPVPSSEN